MQNNKPDYYNNLDEVYSKRWKLLNSGFKNRNASFHIPVFICGNGSKTSGRIIVLRGVNENQKKIWFHSNIKSHKVKILKDVPDASFLFYDKSEKIQLRISGTAKVNYQNDVSKKSWKKTPHMSRQCYLSNYAPGTNAFEPTSGLTEKIDNFKYSIEESEIGYKNFCVIETFVNSIEWLYLAAKGHRRAFFLLRNDQVDKKWLIP